MLTSSIENGEKIDADGYFCVVYLIDNTNMPNVKAPLNDANVLPKTLVFICSNCLKSQKRTCFSQANSPDQSQHMSNNPQLHCSTA